MSVSEGEKILIVDDDERLRRLLERFLTEQGFRVRGVENTEQSNSADRPGLRASGEQRNAISDMSDAELRLESLSSEHPLNQQPQSNQPAAQQEQPDQSSSNAPQSDDALSPPPLQLESVQ